MGLGAALGIIVALVPVVRGSVSIENPLRKLASQREAKKAPPVSGIDLTRVKLRPRRVVAPLDGGRLAELTLDPVVQRAARTAMRKYRVPEAGVVMMDVKTGELLAYASHVNDGEPFDVNARAEPPAASIFKVVSGAAFVEKADLSAKTEQCYHGGKSRIMPDELEQDARRDKWCATLGMAMGRSINVVFGRLAQKHLTPEDLTEVGGAFGFGAPVPFVVENEPSQIDIPQDPLEFARAAAGFWHTSLSPLLAASIAQAVANGGVALAPRIVRKVFDGEDVVWEDEGGPVVLRRAIKPETAREVTRMMVETVANGSGYKTFHDAKGRGFIPAMAIAGKTGTLTRHKENRHYTWFVGFAPADKPEVAIAALVVNTPLWRIKGPVLARDVLRAYFAKQGRAGVTAP